MVLEVTKRESLKKRECAFQPRLPRASVKNYFARPGVVEIGKKIRVYRGSNRLFAGAPSPDLPCQTVAAKVYEQAARN